MYLIAAVVFIAFELVEPGFALGFMVGVGLLRHLKGSLAAAGSKRRIKIHHDRVFLIQMDIELLGLPGTVFGGGFGVLSGIARGFHGFAQVLVHEQP